MVALSSERKATVLMKERGHELLKNVTFICPSDESPFLEEKESVYLWMFENYRKKAKKTKISDEVLNQLKTGLKEEKSGCNIM